MLVEIVQHDVRQLAALELDDDPHAVAVGFVAQVGNALDLLVAHELGHVGDQLRLVDLIRNLRDDDRHAVALLVLLDRRLAADHDAAAAFAVRPGNSRAADDGAAGGKIRTWNGLKHRAEAFVSRRGPPLDDGDHAVNHLAHVVRRDARGHADRDAGRSVHEQARKRRRQDRGLVVGLSSNVGRKSTVSLSRSAIIVSASDSRRASV